MLQLFALSKITKEATLVHGSLADMLLMIGTPAVAA
jgi:hypothetical protein